MLIERMVRAARLDPALYNEVERDESATAQALAVVLIVAACSVIGSAFTGHHAKGLIGAGISAVLIWLIYSFILLLVGRMLGGTADVGEVMRTLGFANSPNVLQVFAFFPLFGPLIGLAAGIWTMVATVIAVREAMDFDTGKAVVTMIIPLVALMALIVTMSIVAVSLGLTLAALLGR